MSDHHTHSALAAVLAVGSGLLLIRQGIRAKGIVGLVDILLGVAAIQQWLYAEPSQDRQRLALAPPKDAGEDEDKALVEPEDLLKTPFQSS